MSQADPEAANSLSEEGATPGSGRSGYPPPPGQNQPFQGSSNFVDGSGPLFSMYVERATEHDRKMTSSWKGDADGILVFTGLFSAAVASLAAVSVQDLRPSSQDTSAFYLANIYQLLADANGTHVPIPSSLLDPLAPFSPPTHAIWVNTLWFLSLVISLTCALLATLLQQWARRYIKITQPRSSPDKHARIRAFFSEGVEKLHLPWAVEALPALLHLSLFLFFSGLLVFLSNIHHTVFSAAASWIGLCVATYAAVTIMPIFRHDSPYYAPLSTSAWYLVSGTLFFLFRILHHFPFFKHLFRVRFGDLKDHYRRWFSLGLSRITEETARKPSPEMDGRLLTWAFDCLDEDIELELFFSNIPGLCSSTVVMDPLGTFVVPNEDKLVWALIGLMDRTLASQLVPNTIKQRRSAICVKAMDAASLPLNGAILDRVFSEEWDGVLSSVELGLFLRKVDYNDPSAASYSQCAISIIISREQERNSRWFALATGHLDVSGSVLRNYLEHGDSVLLFNCIYITRYIIDIYSQEGWMHSDGSRSKTLESVTKFDIRSTLPGLQHEFCRLWNDTVRTAQNSPAHHIRSICILALKHIRNAYISLHRETNASPRAFSTHTDIDDPILDDPLSYPLCNVGSDCHIPPANSTSTIHEITATAPQDLAAVLPRNLMMTADPAGSSAGLDVSPPSLPGCPNTSRAPSNSVPTEPRPSVSMIVPGSSPHQSPFPATSLDPAPLALVHGVIADAVEGTVDTTTTNSLSVANLNNIVPPMLPSARHNAPPFPTPTIT